MSASAATLVPITESDESFLTDLYASTRAAEMSLVAWADEQKRAFLTMQFQAQDRYYRERYPTGSFEIVKINDRAVGRFYRAELTDEIRIIDLVFLPEHFDPAVFVELVERMVRKSEQTGKPLQTFLESTDPNTDIFISLGFQKVDEHGIYYLWRLQPGVLKTQ